MASLTCAPSPMPAGAGAAAAGAPAALARPALRRSGQASGIVSKVAAAMVSIAHTQPALAMMACISGANTNWPKEPPALMKPAANARRSAGRRCAVAPIRIEKLPAPAPAADRKPIVMIRPHCELMKGVSAVPAASSSAPRMITRAEPHLSATAPNTGCASAPHELADRHREADRGDAQPGRGVDRRQEQAGRQARAHGDHQDRGRGQDQHPRGARGHLILCRHGGSRGGG
jgi:hypothetical protein